MTTDRREPRGPDPISRWLGDDSPPPGSGGPRRAYADAGDFVARLDADASLWAEVTPPSSAFEYDGRYTRRYASDASDASEVSGRDGYPTGDVNWTRPPDASWTYVTHCDCEQCRVYRQLHENPTRWSRYVDEWRRAVDGYRPTTRPPRRPPRLRSFYERVRREVRQPTPEPNVGWQPLDADVVYVRIESNFDLLAERAQQVSVSLRDLGAEVSFITTVSEPVRRPPLGDWPLSLGPDDELDRWADDGGRIGPVDY